MLKQGNDKIAFFCDQRDPVGRTEKDTGDFWTR